MTQALYEVDRMISRFLVVDGILRLELGWLVLFLCSDSGLLLSRNKKTALLAVTRKEPLGSILGLLK